jgi:DNA ligase-4
MDSSKNGGILVSFCDADFFPALRLFLPKLDKRRIPYGIKEAKLAKLYIEALQIPPNSKVLTDSLKLSNILLTRPKTGLALLSWKTTRTASDSLGDFAAVASVVLVLTYGIR